MGAQASSNGRLFLGVDIGGTTLSVGLVNEHGSFVGSPPPGKGAASPVWSEELGDDHAPQVLAQRVRKLAECALREAGGSIADLSGVGVGVPGLMDVEAGIVRVAANLKGWRDVPVCDVFAEAFGIERSRVALENDCKAALLAEVWVGAAVGCKNAVLLTVGTGVGGAILCDGRLLRGRAGQAGEVGHCILMPEGGRAWGSAGVDGIFEAYASCRAVAHRAVERDGPPTSSSLHAQLARAPGGGYIPPECVDVFRKAEMGDEYCMGVVRDTARYLAIGCINCCRFVDPEVILFAGGMVNAGDFLLEEVRIQFAAHHWNIEPVTVGLLAAAAGTHAGVLGAARAAMVKVDA